MKISNVCYQRVLVLKCVIVYQFPLKLPTDLLSVIIPAKYVISKSKPSQNCDFACIQQFQNFCCQEIVFVVGATFLTTPQFFHAALLGSKKRSATSFSHRFLVKLQCYRATIRGSKLPLFKCILVSLCYLLVRVVTEVRKFLL